MESSPASRTRICHDSESRPAPAPFPSPGEVQVCGEVQNLLRGVKPRSMTHAWQAWSQANGSESGGMVKLLLLVQPAGVRAAVNDGSRRAECSSTTSATGVERRRWRWRAFGRGLALAAADLARRGLAAGLALFAAGGTPTILR